MGTLFFRSSNHRWLSLTGLSAVEQHRHLCNCLTRLNVDADGPPPPGDDNDLEAIIRKGFLADALLHNPSPEVLLFVGRKACVGERDNIYELLPGIFALESGSAVTSAQPIFERKGR